MPIDSGNLALKGLDELFTTEEKRQEEQREQVQQIPIDELHPFTNHPFKVVDDEAMTRTVESIAQFGVLAPLIARPRPDGDGYEIISGHRRQFAAKMAGLETLPVIVRDMDDDAATILMVDSNLQREHISPSERAFAYKMKMDAMKRTAGRPPKENPRQVVGNFETADLIGKESGESGRQVQRFIRLTNLIPELLDLVDEKKVSFNPAVELSYGACLYDGCYHAVFAVNDYVAQGSQAEVTGCFYRHLRCGHYRCRLFIQPVSGHYLIIWRDYHVNFRIWKEKRRSKAVLLLRRQLYIGNHAGGRSRKEGIRH